MWNHRPFVKESSTIYSNHSNGQQTKNIQPMYSFVPLLKWHENDGLWFADTAILTVSI